MNTIPLVESYVADLTSIRHDLHAHPEIGFEEARTSAIVAELLRSWSIDVHTGIGGTGVVGVLQGANGSGSRIGLRADMDALPMNEETGLPYRSRVSSKFHGCGHDGHTTMLLGAARYLSATRNFRGTAVFIFQPAEEGLGGARAMLQDGLFERFPCDEIYGFHNWPDLELGQVQVFPGPCMAGADFFDITLHGQGSHAAMPHMSRDAITAAGSLISSIQSIVSRRINPLKSAVVSITNMRGGFAYNVIPTEVHLGGCTRYFSEEVRSLVATELERIIDGCATTFGIEVDIALRNIFSVTVNDKDASMVVTEAASGVVGSSGVSNKPEPSMGSEDFADMLAVVPGAYFFLGHRGNKPLHHPAYHFDDALIPMGSSILARIVESRSTTNISF